MGQNPGTHGFVSTRSRTMWARSRGCCLSFQPAIGSLLLTCPVAGKARTILTVIPIIFSLRCIFSIVFAESNFEPKVTKEITFEYFRHALQQRRLSHYHPSHCQALPTDPLLLARPLLGSRRGLHLCRHAPRTRLGKAFK